MCCVLDVMLFAVVTFYNYDNTHTYTHTYMYVSIHMYTYVYRYVHLYITLSYVLFHYAIACDYTTWY